MTKRIFKTTLNLAISVLISSSLIIIAAVYEYFGGVSENQFRQELAIAAQGTEMNGESFLAKLDTNNYRLTWISDVGEVLFDSEVDRANMENHLDREEIQEALKTGEGSSSRNSRTLTQKTIYEAKLLKDGSVLRISVSRITVLSLILRLTQIILLVAVFAIALSAILAKRMTKKIMQPLNSLNLDKPMENEAYEELSPLLRRIETQQKEINSQMISLKQRRDEFEQITENLNEGFVLLNEKNEILNINPAAQKFFETDESCIGKNLLIIDRRENIVKAVEEAKKDGHSEFREKINSKEYQFDLSRIESDGKILGVAVLSFDISQQAEAERNRREFTANVSHELKTPLQGIIGSAELLENNIVKAEDVPRFIGHIKKEAARLVTLIEDIIRLSQLDEGTEMPKENVSFLSLANEVQSLLSSSAKSKDITISVSGDNATIFGVRRMLFEIIFNLCDNGIKYNKIGGKVDITVKENEQNVILSVKDTGIGIEKQYQEKIFERFYRVDKSHSKKSGGTGLGLSIVKHAVLLHGGKLKVESVPEQGTAVSVIFKK